tara:strand:- start:506 stop:769 length:264 start_codon:yes stop_codon:yes gene_type:complete
MSRVKKLVKEMFDMEKKLQEEMRIVEKKIAKQEEQVSWLKKMTKEMEDKLFCSKVAYEKIKKTISEEDEVADKYQSVMNNNKDYFSV